MTNTASDTPEDAVRPRTGGRDTTGGSASALQRRRRMIEVGQRSGLVVALALLCVYFTINSGAFATSENLKVILWQVSVVGIISVPGAMLVLAGYVDLAVGSIAVLSAAVFGELAAGGVSVPLAGVVALLTGSGWGAVAALLICVFGMSPIVVTLGGLAAARGVAELMVNSDTKSGFGDLFLNLGNSEPLGLPMPVYLFALAFLVGGFVWYFGPWGRRMMAIGADSEAARTLGVRVRATPFVLYVASGSCAALGGLIVASQLDSASLEIGRGLELEVLTGILLGGVSFVGGRGSLVGVLAGVLFIGVLRNGLVLINVSPYVLGVVTGGALVFAAALDVIYRRLERVPLGDDDRRGPQAEAA